MDPLIFVIFGASGDLTERKLIPAIAQLYEIKSLPENFAVLGVSRTAFSDEAFREKVVADNEHLENDNKNKERLKEFSKHIFYQPIDTNDPEDYAKVKQRLEELNEKFKTGQNYIFYLSTPPNLYTKIPEFLAHHGLNDKKQGWKRVVIEKPFGYDRESALQLNKDLLQFFDEDQIYRIDHYLGKETVQNLLVTRFANGIFEPLWNRNYIDHVQITSAESIGVENRGGYYEDSGALRDMVQNHLLQVVAHVAMEPPITSDAMAIRNEKLKLFQSIRLIKRAEVDKYVVRGQYISSVIDNEDIKGYRNEEGVAKQSKTETFVALKFYIDNWRWAGIPFYIRTGKRLPTKVTEVVINFKKPPHHLFMSEKGMDSKTNQLIVRIQPNEGLLLKFGMKVPGEGFRVTSVDMDFHYSDLTESYVPEAYERLILDVIKGDPTLYARGDSVEAAWNFVDPILEAWAEDKSMKLYGYPAGTWGPEAADKLISKSGNGGWRNPCKSLASQDLMSEL